jgi:hypothetical protein
MPLVCATKEDLEIIALGKKWLAHYIKQRNAKISMRKIA